MDPVMSTPSDAKWFDAPMIEFIFHTDTGSEEADSSYD